VLSRVQQLSSTLSTETKISGLATLCLKLSLVRQIDFKIVIDSFASEKARQIKLK